MEGAAGEGGCAAGTGQHLTHISQVALELLKLFQAATSGNKCGMMKLREGGNEKVTGLGISLTYLATWTPSSCHSLYVPLAQTVHLKTHQEVL